MPTTALDRAFGLFQVHPQSEEYWGHVNPIGPRACYDEGKRVAETMCYAYEKQENISVRVARFVPYFRGPSMMWGIVLGGAPCAVRKVGCFPPPVATGPRVLNSAPHAVLN